MNTLRLIPIAAMLAIFCVPFAQGQTEKHAKHEKTTTVTGCLMKGDQANEYKITENGTTYDLYPTANIKLDDHVGHKVTVTGNTSAAQSSEMNTANRTAGERLEVTKIKHVSKTCP